MAVVDQLLEPSSIVKVRSWLAELLAVRTFVILVPLVFVVYSWLAGAGFPIYLDNNETFLSYVHARNLETWDPWSYGWLTTAVTDPKLPGASNIYAHNPNAPRYLHYLLLRAGVRDLPHQTVILSLLGATLSVMLLWRLFGTVAPLAVLAVVLDFSGFLAWTVNTYRVWTFVLYFGLALAVVRKRPLWLGVGTFLLFQVEYGLALFIGTAMTVLALLIHRKQAWLLILASAVGAALSLALFAAQVVTAFGLDGALADLANTYIRRGTGGATGGMSPYLWQGWFGLYSLLLAVTSDTYNPFTALLLVYSLVASPIALWRDATSQRRLLAQCCIAALVGAFVTSTLLYGYFRGGFVDSHLPLATFLIAPAVGSLALDLHAQVSRHLRWRPLGVVCAVVALSPVLLATAAHIHKPVATDLVRWLQSDLNGAPMVGTGFMPELAYAFGASRATVTYNVALSLVDLVRVEAIRDATGRLGYLCYDGTAVTSAGAAADVTDSCHAALPQMLALGHELLADGRGWMVVRINRPDQRIMGARDEQRRADLLAIKQRLEAAARQYGRFPCTPDGAWRWSSDPSRWLLDAPEACGTGTTTAAPVVLSDLPADPVNLGADPWSGGFAYGYRGWRPGCPEALRGQWYIVVARLEQPDPNRPPIHDCDGGVIPWPPEVVAVTSD